MRTVLSPKFHTGALMNSRARLGIAKKCLFRGAHSSEFYNFSDFSQKIPRSPLFRP